MRARHKLQEDHGVDRHIATSRSTDDSPEDTESSKVAQASDGGAKQASDDQCGIECWLSADEIGAGAPEEGTRDQASVVCDRAEMDVCRPGELEYH